MAKVRQIRIEGDVAYVPLTQGKAAVIDAADVYLVEGVNWYAMKAPKTFYARRNSPRDPLTGKRNAVLLHRVIAGVSDDTDIDHKDCDGLNCRRDNLRPATKAENKRNRRCRSDSASGVKGVFRDPQRKHLWVAAIRVDGKRIHLGRFKSIEQAENAYKIASAEHHGEFGRTR